MRITVLIPTYRRTADMERCLMAVLDQSRPADQVLLIVRDSDEETLCWLAACEARGSSVEVLLVREAGVVAALNLGLSRAVGDIIAITDDDAAPRKDWLAKIEQHFAMDPLLGGLGGRDWVHQNGTTEDGVRHRVGKLQWFGRVTGNHHLGAGAARDADVLKGVNMSYRRSAVGSLRFDPRLRGTGAQVYNDMDFSMAVKHKGWRLVYDPDVAVDHYPARRFDEDQRNSFHALALFNMAHNETLVMLRYLNRPRRIAYLLWAFAVGMASTPGLLQWLRLLPRGAGNATGKWAAAARGRREGIRTWRSLNKHTGSNERTEEWQHEDGNCDAAVGLAGRSGNHAASPAPGE